MHGQELRRRPVALAVKSDASCDSVGDLDRVEGRVEALGVGLAAVALQGLGQRHHPVVLVRRVVAWRATVLGLVFTGEFVVLGVVDELRGRQRGDRYPRVGERIARDLDHARVDVRGVAVELVGRGKRDVLFGEEPKLWVVAGVEQRVRVTSSDFYQRGGVVLLTRRDGVEIGDRHAGRLRRLLGRVGEAFGVRGVVVHDRDLRGFQELLYEADVRRALGVVTADHAEDVVVALLGELRVARRSCDER